MAEKKQHHIVSADTGKEVTAAPKKRPAAKQAAPVGNAGGLRFGAVLCWLVAIGMEVLALLVLLGNVDLKFIPTMWQLIAFLVLDLIFVIIGSQLWKKANHIRPASEKNPLLFWLWNNMGVIVTVIAFVPLIVLMLTNKDVDKKTKAIATVVAVIALLIGGLASYDFNPVSEEQQQAAINVLGDESVYWSPFGKVYHIDEDCGALNHSDELTYGTVEQAIAAGRTRLCSFCARRNEVEGVVTDGREVTDADLELVETEVEEK